MYTRCPECSTIFRVTAEQLRAALGKVSCGSCGTTFNALMALSEDLPALREAVLVDPVESPADNAAESAPESDDDDVVDVDAGDSDGVDEAFVDTMVDEPEELALRGDDDDAESAAEQAGEPSEPRYDDNTGIEEALTDIELGESSGDAEAKPDEPSAADVEESSEPVKAAGIWSNILADVDDKPAGSGGEVSTEDDEPIAAEPADEDDTAVAADPDDGPDEPLAAEPAYDDDTGYEEALDEEDFDIGAADEESPRAVGEEIDELEFDAPEQTWSEIFVPQDDGQPVFVPPTMPATQNSADGEELDLSPLSALESETADPDEWAGFLSDLTGEDNAPREADAAVAIGGDDFEPDDDEDHPVIVLGSDEELTDADDANALNDVAAAAAPEFIQFEDTGAMSRDASSRPDPLIDYEPEFVPSWDAELADEGGDTLRRALPRKRSIAIAAALVLALGLQFIHLNRDSLAANPNWGSRVRAVYSFFGHELYPHWNLDAYRISGSEAVAGRSAPMALDVIANIIVTGEQPVGMPMVRVALRDRWSNPVASRVFAAPEYLRDYDEWPAMLSPGTSLPVEISVADPGTDAHGYVVDICLPQRASGLQCQQEKNPFQQ